MFCGSRKQVAHQMEEWFTAPACDGFVLAASSMPGAYDNVVRLLSGAPAPRSISEGKCRPDATRESRLADTARRRLARGAPAGFRMRHSGS